MSDTTHKRSLPGGWIVKVSNKFPDRIYYFNIKTGASTWECPKFDPPGRNREPFIVLSKHKSLKYKYVEEHQNWEMKIDAEMAFAKQILRDVLDKLFEKEMDETFGDDWHCFPVKRHSLKGILNGIIQFWKTVFTFLFSKEDKEKFVFLKEKANRSEGFSGERRELLSILKTIGNLFLIIKRKWNEINVPFVELRIINGLILKGFSSQDYCEKCLNHIEYSIKEAEINCCLEVLNHNWTVINYLCGCSLEFCGIPNNLVYYKSAPIPPKPEFLRVIPILCHSLAGLIDIMDKMIEIVRSSSPNDAVFYDFHKALINLVPSMNIQVDSSSIPDFTPKLLERFCRLPENRTSLEKGFKNLLEFNEKLGIAFQILLN